MSQEPPDLRLAYDTPRGRAWYVAGSGLAGEPMYRLEGRQISHQALLLLLARADDTTSAVGAPTKP